MIFNHSSWMAAWQRTTTTRTVRSSAFQRRRIDGQLIGFLNLRSLYRSRKHDCVGRGGKTVDKRDAIMSAMQGNVNTTTSVPGQGGQQPFTLVGGGRVGEALKEMGGNIDTVIGREGLVDGPPGPIVVCTRNDALDNVVERTPKDRQRDLVFIQNGMLQPWLDEHGLGDNTQVLVFFAVAKKGDAPTDGKTDTNPEGLTAATGPWAETFAARLHAAGLSCKVLDSFEYKKSMLEKLIWISSFMLVGARHGGCSVGDVESKHREEVGQLIRELAVSGSAALHVKLDDGFEERLCAYARSVAHFPTAVKEFQWRNGWFYSLSEAALKEGQDDPCPLHTSWLKEVGAI